MNNTLSPINDTSSKAFDKLFARFQELDLECLLVYLFDKVDESALIHLAEQFHITGNEGWAGCSTEAEKRDLIKNSLNLHRYRGTKYSLVRVLEILGLNGKVSEWFEYGGYPYYFRISIDMNDKGFDEFTEQQLLDLITANKNVRSHLESLIIHLISTAEQRYASYATTSEEVTVLETARRIHDKTGIGLLLVGKDVLFENLCGRNNEYDQLYSRVKYHKKLNDRILISDVRMILEAVGQDPELASTYYTYSDGITRKLEHLITHSSYIAKTNGKVAVDSSVIKKTSELLMGKGDWK